MLEIDTWTIGSRKLGRGVRSGNLESTGIAKDAMKLIAQYDTYAVLKGTIPSVPGPAATGSATPDAGASSQARVGR